MKPPELPCEECGRPTRLRKRCWRDRGEDRLRVHHHKDKRTGRWCNGYRHAPVPKEVP